MNRWLIRLIWILMPTAPIGCGFLNSLDGDGAEKGDPDSTNPVTDDADDNGNDTTAFAPKATDCGSFAAACFDELSHIPVDLLAFRPVARWSRTTLTWTIVKPLPESRLSFNEQRRAASEALVRWALVTPLTFQNVDGRADITISFEGREHTMRDGSTDPFPFDGPGGVRAHAFFPGTGAAGEIHLDAEENWSLEPAAGRTHLPSVLVHEIGHALGLEHLPAGDGHGATGVAAMAPGYPEEIGIKELSPRDTEAIQRLYGSDDGSVKPVAVNDVQKLQVLERVVADDDNPDTDQDGIPDSLEIFVFDTDYLIPDTDADGLSDFQELFVAHTPPTDSGSDFDGDGLSDGKEAIIGTSPTKTDTDDDGLSDGEELLIHNTDPLIPDTDDDGILDGVDPFPITGCIFGGDCNGNGQSDECDIRDGLSRDENLNGVPDECDLCIRDDDCDDGLFCNGLERCTGAACQAGLTPCGAGTRCDEEVDQCLPP